MRGCSAPSGLIGVTEPKHCTLENLVDHIDCICQIADLCKVAEILTCRGYGQADVDGIMYQNWVKFFERALK